MAVSEALLKEEVARIARALHAAGWVANHDGNITVRLPDGRLLATPTAVSKRLIGTDRVLTLDAGGKHLEGPGKPFSELNLHLAAYRARPDITCVLHAHPPTATGFAVAGRPLQAAIIAEAVVSIGANVPLVPYARPGTRESAAAVAAELTQAHVVLLENHGVLAVGSDLEQAFCRAELAEHLAKITLAAEAAGQPRTIPAEDVAALLEKRRKAGLEPPGATAGPAWQPDSSAGAGTLLERVLAELATDRPSKL